MKEYIEFINVTKSFIFDINSTKNSIIIIIIDRSCKYSKRLIKFYLFFNQSFNNEHITGGLYSYIFELNTHLISHNIGKSSLLLIQI